MDNQQKSHYDLKNKKPAFLEALYPYKAVGEFLDVLKLDDMQYIDGASLYELKCPNCDLSAHVRGSRLKDFYDRFLKVGCPECKLQFGGQVYIFKDGEKEKPLPENNGKYSGFYVRKVVEVPQEIFIEYAKTMFNKSAEDLTLEEGNKISEKYYIEKNGN